MAYLLDTCYSTRSNWDKTKSLSKQELFVAIDVYLLQQLTYMLDRLLVLDMYPTSESPIAITDDSFVATDDSSAATDEHQLQHMSIYA
ncbi:hypothetical protein H5410_047354 [Solanum commersonii]|uniref:Uncharacterized protein n=1 Tax=Solanum commersonii TaxID=4109 RepID=A0A9J5XIW7_SOLCO|nr:hypothetical protein H5410_047354 [Solanum commersonii]